MYILDKDNMNSYLILDARVIVFVLSSEHNISSVIIFVHLYVMFNLFNDDDLSKTSKSSVIWPIMIILFLLFSLKINLYAPIPCNFYFKSWFTLGIQMILTSLLTLQHTTDTTSLSPNRLSIKNILTF